MLYSKPAKDAKEVFITIEILDFNGSTIVCVCFFKGINCFIHHLKRLRVKSDLQDSLDEAIQIQRTLWGRLPMASRILESVVDRCITINGETTEPRARFVR